MSGSDAPHAHLNIHATGIVLGSAGLVIRGPSGAGKSLLALELIDRWQLAGQPAWLVGDDRLDVRRRADGLCMSGPHQIAGQIELRGYGITTRPVLASARVDLLVDLVDELIRMPEAGDLADELLGVEVRRCPVPRRGIVDSAHQMLLVGEALRHAAALGLGKTQEFT